MKESPKHKTKIFSRIIKLLILLLLLFFLITVLISYALTKPKFQNWTVDKVTSVLSKRINGNVEVDSISFDYSHGLNLWNVVLENDQQDTLLSLGFLSSTLADNLKSLISSELYLNTVSIKDLDLDLEKMEDGSSSWSSIIESCAKPKKKTNSKESKKFVWDINALQFENINLSFKEPGNHMKLSLPKGELIINSIDIDSLDFNVESLHLVEPYIDLLQSSKRSGIVETEDSKEENQKIDNKKKQNPLVALTNLIIENGTFKNSTPNNINNEVALDYKNMIAENLDLELKDLVVNLKEKSSVEIRHFSVLMNKEFDVKKMSAKQLSFSGKNIIIDDYLLQTNESQINTNASLKYRSLDDFSDFENRVFLNTNFNNSQISVRDIAYLIPAIENEKAIQKNINEIIFLNGEINGRVNNFSTNGLSMIVPDKVVFEGNFRARNILKEESTTTINIEVDKLSTSIRKLSQVIPDFNPPENFYKLGQIDFRGRFDGFVDNFVAFGDLQTSLGRALTDMQLDLSKGRQNAKYSGEIELIDFDLNGFTGNDDFGVVSFKTKVENGSGLTSQTAMADMNASLQSFTFKEHEYKDLELDGRLERNLFIGSFQLNDPSAVIDFDGSFIYEDEILKGDFIAKIEKLELHGLNLSKDSLSFSGDLDVEIQGSNLDNFEGDAMIRNLDVSLNGKSDHFESVYINSTPRTNGNRSIQVNSEVMDVLMNGKINFNFLVNDILSIVAKENPLWANYLNLSSKEISDRQNFDFSMHVEDSKNILAFFDMEDIQLKNLDVEGTVNSSSQLLSGDVFLDSLIYKENIVTNLKTNLNHEDGQGNLKLLADKLMAQNQERSMVELTAVIDDDVLTLGIVGGDEIDSLAFLDFIIEVVPVEKNLTFHIIENRWEMLGTDWFFDPDNKVTLGDKKIFLENLILDDGERSIELSTRGGEDILVQVSELDFELLNPIIDYDNIYFSGPIDVVLQADNIFETPELIGSVQMDSLLLNGDDYGALTLYINENTDKNYNLDLDIVRIEDGQVVRADVLVDKKSLSLDGKLMAENFSLGLFEYIIPDGISNTTGGFDLECDIKGNLPDVRFRGYAAVEDAGVTVDYIGSHFTMQDQEIRITEKVIDVTSSVLNDSEGNEATLTGGLYHDFFKDLRLNLKVSSNKFIMLDTDKYDNSSYYGKGIGYGNITFDGPFSQTDIVITATSLPNTVLNIPLESDYEEVDESFIQFVEAGTLYEFEEDSVEVKNLVLEGSNVEMNLTITPDALVNIIFDDNTNDKITGRGRGNVRLVAERTGVFDVFGDYTVESGEYLFTAFGIVAKPFTLEPGGTIVWTGDPLDATLNIKATYEGLNSPVSVFLAEYISSSANSESLEQEAKRRTDIDLGVIIKGSLFNPDIDFDITIPNLQGELRSHAENKLTILRQNPSDMNDQVAGLLLFNSFIPSNNPQAGNFYSINNFGKTGYNTVSEFLSSQLSSILSGLVDEALVDEGLISGIDFEIGFNKDLSETSQLSNTGLAPDEIEVNFKPQFKNDRLSLDFGTNYVRESVSSVGNYIFVDWIIEYALTTDRRLRFRVYGKNDFDEIVSERERKYGVGVRYRKEFGDLSKFKEAITQEIKANLGEGKE